MSHFSVMVIGDDWEKQLAPYDENSEDSQFIQFTSEEEEFLKEYNEGSQERIVMPDGRLLLPWDEAFRLPGQFGFGSNTHKVPDNLEKRLVPFKETFPTFEEFVKGWHGKDSRDSSTGQYGYWHNPNAKWDWYQMGGRWAGYFRLKEKFYLPPQAGVIIGETGLSISEISNLIMLKKNSPSKYAAVLKKYKGKVEAIDKAVEQFSNSTPEFQSGVRGSRGLMGAAKHEGEGYADQTKKCDIDIEYMRLEAEAGARQQYQRVAAIFPEGAIPNIKPWKEFLEEHKQGTSTIENSREAYHAQEAVQLYDEAAKKDHGNFGFFDSLDNYQMTEEQYVKLARDSAIAPFAIIKDGKWYEKGEMGWWGMVGNEKGQKDWNDEFTKLFDSLPDDTLITCVDCHI